MDNKTYQLNTNLITFFSGKYNTFWDDPKDQELEDEQIDNNQDLSNDNYLSMNDILSAYKGSLSHLDFNIDFIKNIELTGFYSPKYYNYSTDVIEFDLTIDYDQMLKTLATLEHNQDFNKFLKDNYSDRDGFWSRTPNSFNSLRYELSNDNNTYFDQSLGALITYLTGQDKLSAIELDAYYNSY